MKNKSLVSAKRRVESIKKLSIPRLELFAEVLVIQLIQQIKTSVNSTNSTTVLGWLSSHPRRLPTFIANGTSDILQQSTRDQWSHVTTSSYPADIAYRGLPLDQLKLTQLWCTGPQWLSKGAI